METAEEMHHVLIATPHGDRWSVVVGLRFSEEDAQRLMFAGMAWIIHDFRV